MAINLGIIPAAGQGLRTIYLGKMLPKCLLPLYDRPILHYIVSSMVNAGVTEIIVVTNYKEDLIQEYISSTLIPEFHVKITTVHQEILNGDGNAVLTALKTTNSNRPFYVVLGDDVSYPIPLISMATIMLRKKALIVEGIVPEPSFNKLKLACSVRIMNEHIIDIIEKPTTRDNLSMIRGCGIYAFHPDVFNQIPEKLHWISDIIKQHIPSRRVYNCILEANININTPDDLLEASLFLKECLKYENPTTTC